MSYFEALFWTLALELPVVLLLGRIWSIGAGRLAAAGLLASLLTHPLAWWAAGELPPDFGVVGWFAIECAVAGFEAVFYRHFLNVAWTRAFVLSFVANGLSAFAGWLPT